MKSQAKRYETSRNQSVQPVFEPLRIPFRNRVSVRSAARIGRRCCPTSLCGIRDERGAMGFGTGCPTFVGSNYAKCRKTLLAGAVTKNARGDAKNRRTILTNRGRKRRGAPFCRRNGRAETMYVEIAGKVPKFNQAALF